MTSKPIVFYNGACPVCRREIDHYRHLDRSQGDALAFADIEQDSGKLASMGLSHDEARRRLHVLAPDGRLLSGMPAFAAIWERLPRYRWLASASRLPVLRQLLPWLYEAVAFGLYRWDRRRRCSTAT